MATEADYDFMKAVFVEMNKQTQVPLSHMAHKKKAFSQVRARLFTINLNLRGELPSRHHEALMSELKEKLPAFRESSVTVGGWGRNNETYHDPYLCAFWLDLLKELKVPGRNIWKKSKYQREYVNKKEYLIEVLTGNGVACNKKWTLNRLVKAL